MRKFFYPVTYHADMDTSATPPSRDTASTPQEANT